MTILAEQFLPAGDIPHDCADSIAIAPDVADRVAMLVVHSNPVAEPGVGDAGGMTVYVRQMARSLAARGLAVDVYTRRDAEDNAIVYSFATVDESPSDYVADRVCETVERLRELSPLYEMAKEGVDLSKVVWAAH